MPRMIESNCLIYWINHFSTNTHKCMRTSPSLNSFSSFLFSSIVDLGLWTPKKSQYVHLNCFCFFCCCSSIHRSNKARPCQRWFSTNKHSAHTHTLSRERKKTNPNQRNRVLCFRAYTKNDFQYLWSKIYSNLCSTPKCLCLVSTKLANNLRFGFFFLCFRLAVEFQVKQSHEEIKR